MNKKYIAVFAIVLAVMMFAPALTTPVKASPAVMNTLQYRYFSSQDAVWTALQEADSAGGIDSMQWTMTKAEYTGALTNTALIVEPVAEAGEDEIAFNNNVTDGIHMDRRSPMNFTDFRNALTCLVDKAGVIAGPMQGGFASQDDVQIPTPLMSGYVNPAIVGANYPWKFNVTNALSILWRGNWYNHAMYPLGFTDLLNAYTNGSLAGWIGTNKGVVYPGNDPWDIWGGGDVSAQASIYTTEALANLPIDQIEGWVRQGDARKNLGEYFITECQDIGLPVLEHPAASILDVYPVVMDAQTYDFATLGYSMGAPPSYLYGEVTPGGIFADGPNSYLIYDSNITTYATAMWFASTAAAFLSNCYQVQYIMTMESYLVPAYTPGTYCAYKSNMLGQIDIIGNGAMANGGAAENWITLDARKNNTIAYTGNNPPESNIFYLGLYNPPNMINPIFQSSVYDFQVTDEIFTWPMQGNPYTISVGSTINGVPTGGDLPYMVWCWNMTLINNPEDPLQNASASTPYSAQWCNVTYWFRNDIKFQDGVGFTDLDLNYTMYLEGLYGDGYDHASMLYAVNTTGLGDTVPITSPNNYAPYFTQDPSPGDPQGLYTCSVLVKSPSYLNLYLPLWNIFPMHLWKYIVPDNIAAAEAGTDKTALHGLWPGYNAKSDEFLPVPPGAAGDAPYITFGNVTSVPDYTLIGTGPFAYRSGSTNPSSYTAGGGITLDAYSGFFMPIAPGEISFKYTWVDNSGNAIAPTTAIPQAYGGYYKVGLSDLVLLANAYGTTGTPPSSVSVNGAPGAPHTWNPAADLAAPAGVIGLSDLVTLATHYGWYFGNYSYNAPYPAAERANGGP
jgi:hypothetical protein